jgi:hypothetical protein
MFRTISSGQGREFEGSEGEVLVGVGLAGNTVVEPSMMVCVEVSELLGAS